MHDFLSATCSAAKEEKHMQQAGCRTVSYVPRSAAQSFQGNRIGDVNADLAALGLLDGPVDRSDCDRGQTEGNNGWSASS